MFPNRLLNFCRTGVRRLASKTSESLVKHRNLPTPRKTCLITVCFVSSTISGRKECEKRKVAYISLNNNESIENALRRFKRKVITEEIIKDLKRHAHFVPPGQKAKLKSVNARKRNRKRFRQAPRPMNSNPNQGYNQNR